MHKLMEIFHQGQVYPAQIAIRQADINRKETFTDQNTLSILSLQTDYLNLESRSGCDRNIEIANTVQKKYTFCEGVNQSAEKKSK